MNNKDIGSKLFKSIDNFLVINLFIVIIFALFFIFSILMEFNGYPIFLSNFRKIWNPIILPLITILITGALVNGIFTWLRNQLHSEDGDI